MKSLGELFIGSFRVKDSAKSEDKAFSPPVISENKQNDLHPSFSH